MSFERYRAAAGVSKSMLDILAERTPEHLQVYVHEPPDETEATRFGTILHRALLEPDTYRNGFHVKPEKMSFATKEGKAWRDEHQDRPIVNFEDEKAITAMVGKVHTHPFAKRLLANAETEKNLFVIDGSETLRKSRLDALTRGNALPDIKTCTAADLDSIERAISNYRYHVQGAYYLDNCKLAGLEKDLFYLIFVEKEPPYAVHCVEVMLEVIEWGRRLYQRDLQLYRNCIAANEWPSYELGFSQAGLPSWQMKQIENAA